MEKKEYNLGKTAPVEPQGAEGVTVYHGKYAKTKTGKRFGGIHVGTRKASEQRLADIMQSETSRVGPVQAKQILGESNIEEMVLDTSKIYRADNPMDEQSGEYKILEVENSPQRQELINQGYSGVAYKNAREDAGSVSYLVFDKSSLASPLPRRFTLSSFGKETSQVNQD